MATLTLQPPAPFNFTTPDEWPKWICIFCRLSLQIRQKISSRQLKGDHVHTCNHGIVCINSVRCELVLSLGCQRVTRGYVFCEI